MRLGHLVKLDLSTDVSEDVKSVFFEFDIAVFAVAEDTHDEEFEEGGALVGHVVSVAFLE